MENLSTKLKSLEMPKCLDCSDLACKEENHLLELDDYVSDVLSAMESAGKETLPTTGSSNSKKRKVIPGWSEYVKPYSDENKFWASVWKSQGHPRSGYVLEQMKYHKKQYNFSVRRLKRCKNKIQDEKFL